MKNLIQAEVFLHRKSRILKVLFLLVLLICLFSALMMYMSWGEAVNIHVKKVKIMSLQTEQVMKTVNAEINHYNAYLALDDEHLEMYGYRLLDEETRSEYEILLEEAYAYRIHNSELTRLATDMSMSYSGLFLKSYMEEQYDFNKLLLDAFEKGYPLYMEYLGNYSKEQIEAEIQKTEIIDENAYWPEYNQYDLNSTNFLFFLLHDYPMFFILILLVFYVIKSFADTDNIDAYKSVYGSAYSRTQINSVKIVVTTIVLLLLVGAAVLITYLVFGLIFGFGSFSYPVIVSLSETNVIITSKLALMLKQLPFTLLVTINILLLSCLFAMITNSNSRTLNLMGLYIVIYGLHLLSDKILQYTPLYYLTMHETMYYDSQRNLLIMGLIFLASIIILLLILGYGKRKDLLGAKK